MPKATKGETKIPAEPEMTDLIDLSTQDTETDTMHKTFNVRRSIDELEAQNNTQKVATPKKRVDAGPSVNKPKLKLTFSQSHNRSPEKTELPRTAKAQAPQKQTITASTPNCDPKLKYAGRLHEAKSCVVKVKTHLNSNSAKNISSLIKQEVTQAIDRIYELLKESEGKIKGQVKDRATQTNSARECKDSATQSIQTCQTGEEERNPKEANQDKENRILKKLEEHTKALEDNSKKIEELKNTIEEQKENLVKASYASVAARKPDRPQEQKTLHSIIISSNDETETGEQVMEKTRNAINVRDGGIQIEKMRKARNQKVIMGFKTVEERAKVKDRIQKAGSQLTVEEVENKDPLLVLRNVLNIRTDEEIVECLRVQNRGLFHGLDRRNDRIEVKYRKRARNPHQTHVVVKVSPILWRRALEAGMVSIDIQPIKVEDQSPLVQCSLCLGYGHARKYCLETVLKCSHCGGEHKKSECPGWLTRDTPECCNCTKAKLENYQHNAFSSECPVRRRWETLARSTVAYC